MNNPPYGRPINKLSHQSIDDKEMFENLEDILFIKLNSWVVNQSSCRKIILETCYTKMDFVF